MAFGCDGFVAGHLWGFNSVKGLLSVEQKGFFGLL